MKLFKLNCTAFNSEHATFQVFDPVGAHVGTLIIAKRHVLQFVADNWKGKVFWNGLFPKDLDLGALKAGRG